MSNLIYEAVKHYDVKMLRILLRTKSLDPSMNGNEALLYACTNGYEEKVKILILDDRVGDIKFAILIAFGAKKYTIAELLYNKLICNGFEDKKTNTLKGKNNWNINIVDLEENPRTKLLKDMMKT